MAEDLKIGFKLKGGLGDILIGANYLYKIRELIGYKNICIDVYAHRNLSLVTALFPKQGFVNHIFLDGDIEDNNGQYDLFVVLNRFPDVRYKNLKKIYLYAPDLIDFVQACEKFRLKHLRFFDHLPVCDGEANTILEILKKKRIQQCDIYDLFNITENFNYELPLNPSSVTNIKNLDLAGTKYITIHRGTDDKQTENSIKLWPIHFYNTLISYIKNSFPDILIVQLGINEIRCPSFDNIDLNLVGKTSVEDLKVLLKNSFLHIDNEGGMVHLRHALHGGVSCVLFGPTSPEVYGYSENLNLRGNGCPMACEWVINSWQSRCVRGFHTLPCMNSLTPEFVFSQLTGILGDKTI
ncbi:predicted protein [Acetobacter sp. CAG:267]|nr:predicted protein [Acetobacter sp. CAG:267]